MAHTGPPRSIRPTDPRRVELQIQLRHTRHPSRGGGSRGRTTCSMPGAGFCCPTGMSGGHAARQQLEQKRTAPHKRFNTELLSCPVSQQSRRNCACTIFRAHPPHKRGNHLPPGGLRPQTPARGCDPWTTQALASGCACFSVKARAPGGLPSPAYLTPVHPSCEGRATAYGWATNPGALGKSGQAIPGFVSDQRTCDTRAHYAGTCARTASDGF